MTLDWLVSRPIAHRGYHDKAVGRVENTLAACEAAVARNFAIEVDLQLSADGEAMVFHDETLDRLTEASGAVAARDAAALKTIPFRIGDHRIPTLSDLFDLVDGKVTLVLEVKSLWRRAHDVRLVERVVELTRAYRGPVALKSFDPDIVAEIKRRDPSITRGIVAEESRDPKYWGRMTTIERFSLRHILHWPRTRPHFVSYWVENLPAPGPSFLKSAFGTPIMTWTVRTPEQRERARRHADQMVFEGFDPEA